MFRKLKPIKHIPNGNKDTNGIHLLSSFSFALKLLTRISYPEISGIALKVS